jgi:hypothetical protein
LLILSLMKSICGHYTNPGGFQRTFEEYVNGIRQKEHFILK